MRIQYVKKIQVLKTIKCPNCQEVITDYKHEDDYRVFTKVVKHIYTCPCGYKLETEDLDQEVAERSLTLEHIQEEGSLETAVFTLEELAEALCSTEYMEQHLSNTISRSLDAWDQNKSDVDYYERY